jgi:Tol biopolymer transport system component
MPGISGARRRRPRVPSLATAALLLVLGPGCSRTSAPTKPPPPPILTTPRVAFARSGGAGNVIELFDPMTGRIGSISPGGVSETEPAISPDGSRIAFTHFALAGAYYQLMTMAVDGRYRQVCTSDSNFSDVEPHWSPDGKRLVFTRTAHGQPPQDVYTIGPDGDSLRRVTNDGNSRALDWSPDGTRLLFVRNSVQLISVAPDGSNPQVLADSGAVFIAGADYTSDGSAIVISEAASNGPRLEAMNADGSNRRTLPDSTQFQSVRRCSWSPDGTAVVFSGARNANEYYRLFVLQVGGTHSELLFPDSVSCDTPDWGPKP